jgi:hypothetical protein
MSAFPPEADIRQLIEHVCFVPEADIRATTRFLRVADAQNEPEPARGGVSFGTNHPGIIIEAAVRPARPERRIHIRRHAWSG